MDGEFLELYNLHTQLVEACEWDEQKSVELFDDALQTYINLYEYSLHDPQIIENEEEFSRLLRLNMKTRVDDYQFKAVCELLDYRLEKGYKDLKVKNVEP